jgi:holo-[acyl-carrier protein] synthase
LSILGLGTDIVSVVRISELLERHGDRFMNRCFSPDEIQWANSRGLGRAASLAGRWAAKEAFLKALGRSVKHIPYGDIEVVRSAAGPISLKLHRRAAEELAVVGATGCILSISHEKEFAIATVLLQSSELFRIECTRP